MALLMVADVAERLTISKPTVYRMLHDGRLSGVRMGRSVRVDAQSVEDYIRANPVVEMGDYGGMAPAGYEQPQLFQKEEKE